ncbi:MAG: thiamine pyrophosphate-dependent enzyme [Dehalococcoidia bacterium]|nr:thiamine pyrophosphate-dependent enzyme [Dehalococcoidia bacterium]
MAMKRVECLKVLAKYRTDEFVIVAWQSINPWQQLSPSKYNFQSIRTMGECSTFGLGLALARPGRRVMVLEGDGSLCMNLGCLVTIAMAAPPNYYQFILHNRVYETTGGQTIPNIDRLDLAMIARGAGIPSVHRYRDAETLERELPELLKEKGPVFILLDIEPDESHLSGKEFGKVRARDKDCNRQFKEALST